MNREYKRYLEEDQHFDRQTLMGIFALLIVKIGRAHV